MAAGFQETTHIIPGTIKEYEDIWKMSPVMGVAVFLSVVCPCSKPLGIEGINLHKKLWKKNTGGDKFSI